MKKYGYTLLELIISMAIMAIIGGVLIGFFSASFRILNSETNRSSLRITIESAMAQFENDLIPAKLVNSMGASSINFWTDMDYDSTQDSNEVFSYSLSNGNLVRTVAGVSKNILYGVTGFNLSYDSAQAASVHLVSLTLTATSGTDSLTVKDQIMLRNNTN